MLGLKHPWTVTRVEVSHEEKRLDIWVDHIAKTPFCCPECAKALSVYDHAEERTWRHLDAFEFRTTIHARPPRVECPDHGVKQTALPWAAPHGRFTLMFEEKVMTMLHETRTIAGARKLLGMTWDEVFGVMERAVERGLLRRGEFQADAIGVDEKAWLKGHSYFTVLGVLDDRTVWDIAKDRKKESLVSLYEKIPEESRESIACISMDMWAPYRDATTQCIPGAEGKIVVDKFHASKMLIKAVDDVRVEEARRLAKDGDASLKKSKYVFGKNEENLTMKQAQRLADLKKMDYEVVRAWGHKELFRHFWQQPDKASAFQFLFDWYKEVSAWGAAPMKAVAEAFWKRSVHFTNWFDHKVSNGPLEALNGLIMEIKRRARGHRSFENLRTAILFYLGGLDMRLLPCPTATH